MEVCHGYTGDRYAYFDFHAADAQPDYSARVVRDAGVNGSFRIEEAGASGLRLQAGNASATVAVDIAGVNRHYTTVNGLMPGVDNAFTLGGSGARWAAIWAANGVIQTSDQRDKLVDAPLAPKRAGAVVDAVAPVLFRWKEGSISPEVTRRETRPMNPANPDSKTIEICEVAEHRRPGKRQHAGFLAQEIKAALEAEGLDFGVWGIEQPEDPESRQWLRPDQMIPLLWAALQETRAELRRLAAKKG
jgi:Chaperone of endosialidase